MSLLLHVMPDWIGLVSLACCTGVLVCSQWVVGTARGDTNPFLEELRAGMWQVLRIGAAVLFVSSILGLLVRAGEMSGYPITGLRPAIPTVLFRTHLGHAWLMRMAAIIGLLATAAGGFRRSRPSRCFMLGCAIVVSAMDSASGHASDAGDFSVPEIMDWLHLTAALVWGGGLVVLSLKILPPLVKQGDRAASSMGGIAARFSRIAGVAVGVIVLTASYQQWAYGGAVEGLPRSTFGRIIIAKIALFSALLILGAFNRYVSVPRLQEWAGSATTRHGALGRVVAPALMPLAPRARGTQTAARFARTVQLEAVLLAAVLLCAALLRHEAPARHAAHLEHHSSPSGAASASRCPISSKHAATPSRRRRTAGRHSITSLPGTSRARSCWTGSCPRWAAANSSTRGRSRPHFGTSRSSSYQALTPRVMMLA